MDGPLRDLATRVRSKRRLDRVAHGNLGDVKPVGQGVFEMRESFGPGWRMYYVVRGHADRDAGWRRQGQPGGRHCQAVKLAAAIED